MMKPAGASSTATSTLAQYLPISLNNDSTKVIPEGQVETAGEPLRPMGYNVVQTDYFKTMGMPIVEGREFTPDDIREGRDVVIVNQVLAERLWPGQTPIGKRLSVTTDKGPFLEVVGVARKAIYNLPGERPRGFLYLPFSWRYDASQIIQIHTEGDPLERLPGSAPWRSTSATARARCSWVSPRDWRAASASSA
jgi:hypothetical protein